MKRNAVRLVLADRRRLELRRGASRVLFSASARVLVGLLPIASGLACGSSERDPSSSAGAAASGAANGGAAGSSSGASGSGASGSGGSAGNAGAASSDGGSGASSSGSGGTAGAGGSAGSGGTSPSTGGTDTAGGAGTAGTGGGSGGTPLVVEELDIGDVWSGHPVNFALVTRRERQFAAFYDANRNLTVASRMLGSSSWTLSRLPSVLGWDSHNHVAMAVDEAGHVHVAGNMHNVPLIYFRTTRAFDVTSFVRVTSMVGSNEASCTYPEFFYQPSGKLVFIYRDGGSGNGNHVFNTYDEVTSTWTRLLGTPLTNGQGMRNAYPVGPIRGADGLWHLVWVWRDTPDAASNHDLSYARSRDLVSWERGNGAPLTLPVTLATSDIVDPVPAEGGMINNNTKVGFDREGRPVVAYHKYDASGNTQIYNARLEAGRWVVHRTTDWTYRWSFGGGGTLVFEIELDGVRALPDGRLVQDFYHARLGGRGTLRLNPETLRAEETLMPLVPYPAELDRPRSTTPGMVVRWARDAGVGPDTTVRFMLRWETLESNRDMPRATIPPATKLRLYGLR